MMNARRIFLSMATVVIAMIPALAGCGILTTFRTGFPNPITNADGVAISIEDLQAITQDTSMLPEDMANALRDLGLQNQELIDAIVADGLGNVANDAGGGGGGGGGNANDGADGADGAN
jgi:hypothetical protein